MTERQTLDNLFEQTKNLELIGARLSGESEVVHDIEDYFRQVEFCPIVRDQIKTILEFVPAVFPEDWKSPDGYDKLNPQQQEAYVKIAKNGLQGCPGPVIQRVIELAVDYRTQYSQQAHKFISAC